MRANTRADLCADMRAVIRAAMRAACLRTCSHMSMHMCNAAVDATEPPAKAEIWPGFEVLACILILIMSIHMSILLNMHVYTCLYRSQSMYTPCANARRPQDYILTSLCNHVYPHVRTCLNTYSYIRRCHVSICMSALLSTHGRTRQSDRRI